MLERRIFLSVQAVNLAEDIGHNDRFSFLGLFLCPSKLERLQVPPPIVAKITDPFAGISPFPNSHSLLLSSQCSREQEAALLYHSQHGHVTLSSFRCLRRFRSECATRIDGPIV